MGRGPARCSGRESATARPELAKLFSLLWIKIDAFARVGLQEIIGELALNNFTKLINMICWSTIGSANSQIYQFFDSVRDLPGIGFSAFCLSHRILWWVIHLYT